ncbi:MAG: glycosyltransferase family 4 protein [Tepidisphaerales bacterium]
MWLLAQAAEGLGGAEAGGRFSVDAVLAPYVYVFYAAFIVSFLFTPIMRVVASHYGIVDKPDGIRKLHREPVAYLGGVAVVLGWLAGMALSRFLVAHYSNTDGFGQVPPTIPLGIVLGGLIIMLLGLVDDIRGVRPVVKIGGQVAAAGALIWSGAGTTVAKPLLGNLNERLQIFFHGTTIDAPTYVPEGFMAVASAVIVIMLVVFCCNAANLMDGLDGLCGGVTAIIALGYVFLAVHVATGGSQSLPDDALRIIIALALLGGVLGFVPYNFNPASIFMGDTGSMFMGFVIAVMILLLGEVASKWLLAALVMFSLPTLDTALAFVRRYVNKRPFFSADKHHIHHQFLARGLTVRQTVLFLYSSALVFVALGAVIAFIRTRYAVGMYLVIFGSIIVAAYKMGMVHEKVKVLEKPNPIGPDDVASAAPPEGVIELRPPPAPLPSPASPTSPGPAAPSAAPAPVAVAPAGTWSGVERRSGLDRRAAARDPATPERS